VYIVAKKQQYSVALSRKSRNDSDDHIASLHHKVELEAPHSLVVAPLILLDEKWSRETETILFFSFRYTKRLGAARSLILLPFSVLKI
jgi:hypothetical protein